jgi:hypothetical protein
LSKRGQVPWYFATIFREGLFNRRSNGNAFKPTLHVVKILFFNLSTGCLIGINLAHRRNIGAEVRVSLDCAKAVSKSS